MPKKKSAPAPAQFDSLEDLYAAWDKTGFRPTLRTEEPATAEPPRSRTWGEAVSDTGAQLAEGVNNIIGAVPSLVAPSSGAASFFRDNADYWRDKQSDPMKRKIAEADAKIATADQDSIIDQAIEAAKAYSSDPALVARFVTTNLPSMIPGIGAAKVAQAAKRASGASAAAAATAGTTAAGATNAVLNAGGARGEAYEDIHGMLIKQGYSPEDAERIALEKSLLPAAVGGVAGFASGKLGLEKALVNGGLAKGGAGAAARSFAGEMLGEQGEEVLPKVATNYQAGEFDQRPLSRDVGRTAVETLVASAPGAVVSGVLEGRNHEPVKPEPSTPPEPAPLQLGHSPDPLIGFPDGTVGRRAEVDAYIASLPEEQQMAARAKLMGVGDGVIPGALNNRDLTTDRDEYDQGSDELPDMVVASPMRAGQRSTEDSAVGGGFDPAVVQAKTFPQFAQERGFQHSTLKNGSPEWNQLRSEWDALKTYRAGNNPEGTGSVGAPTPEIQNRDRSRPASVVQMQGMAQAPDYMRLGPSRSPENGAPMVFANGDQVQAAHAIGRGDVAVMSDGQRVPFQYAVMEASDVQPSNFADGGVNPMFDSEHPGVVKALNNGRTAGLRAAYERGTAERYKAELLADSAQHGIDPAVIEGMQAPMLVRLYSQQDNRTNMGAKSQSQALGMSTTEQAATDAALVDNSVLDTFDSGALDSAGNRDFARAFIGKLQEQGQDVAGMLDANGGLSPAGVTRLQAALVHKAYGDGDLVESMFGSTDNDIRAIGEALKSVAGEWANMRAAAAAGAINPQADVTGNLLQAIRMVQKARRERASLYDAVQQVDMITGEVPDALTVGMLRLLYSGHYLTRALGRDRVAESLRDYLGAALATRAEGDMFGEQVGPVAILSALNTKTTAEQNDASTATTEQPAPSTAQSERTATGGDPAGGRADESGQQEQRPEPDRTGQAAPEDGGRGEGQDAQDSERQPNREGSEGTGEDSRGTVDDPESNPTDVTDTAEFKRWFGDSQVVDADGKPMVMYHGTSADFSAFDQDKGRRGLLGAGFYFTTSPKYASMFAEGDGANVMPVYLKMESPLRVDSPQEAVDALRERGVRLHIEEFTEAPVSEVGALLKKAGFDGVIYGDGTHIVTDPAQIKSATGNNGEFSSDNADIRFSRGQSTKAAYESRIDALFAGGKAQLGTRVLDSSDVMGLLGYPKVPLLLSESHLKDNMRSASKGGHPEMTAEQWKKVPEWIENPAAVYTDPLHPGRVTLIGPDKLDGVPVVIAIEPNPTASQRGAAEPFQLVVTAFAKTSGNLPSLQSLAAGGELLYVHKQNAPEIWRRAGDTPRQAAPLQGRSKILTEKNLAGYRKAQTQGGDAKFSIDSGQGLSPEEAQKLLGLMPKSQPSSTFRDGEIQRVQQLVDVLKKDWVNAPPIEVVYDMQDERVPAVVQRRESKKSGAGAAEGFYFQGKAYLVASQLPTEKDAARVLFHEVLGHHGLRSVFGDRLDPLLTQIVQVRPQEVAAKLVDYKLENTRENRLIAAEEVLANMAEKTPELGFVRRAVAAIQTWLREHGFRNLKVTDAEIIRDFILPARGWVEQGRAGEGAAQPAFQPAFSVNDDKGGRALQEFAKADELFALPKSEKDTVEGIARDNDAGFVVSKPVNFGGRLEYQIKMPDGTTATLSVRDPNPYGGEQVYDSIYTDEGMELVAGRPGENPEDVPPTGDVWIDVSHLKHGEFGAKMYNIAATYAHNTGRIFIGDPHGLSKVALRRRLEQMLSSALKFGTTAHLAPHPDQVRGGSGVPPLRWVYGDDAGNVERMIAASVKALDNAFPQSSLIEYRDGNFYNAKNGKLLPRGRLADGLGESIRKRRALAGGVGSTGQAGWRTIARAALFRFLQSSLGSEGVSERGRLLAEASAQRAGLQSDGSTGELGSPEERKTRIFYSRKSDDSSLKTQPATESKAGQRVSDMLKSVTVTSLKKQAGFKAADLRHLGLQMLGRRQLVDVYGDMLPELRNYSDLMARMDADKNEAGAGADQLATDWGKLKDERALAELMHDATLAQMDPAREFQEGDDHARYGELKRRYQALTPEARDIFARARDTYRKHMRDVRNAIKERIERAEMSSERRAEMLKRMDNEFFGHIKGVYFPLARFGQYLVVVKDAEGKVSNVSRAETMAEADAARRQLLQAFPSGRGFSVGKVLKAKDFVADRDTVGRGFMEQLYGVIDKQGMDGKQRAELEDALGQLYLSSLPDLSWAKHGIHRKGTPGFSQDARRAFAQNVFHGASYLAKLRYGDQLQEQLADMQKRVDVSAHDESFDSVKGQHVVDEMVKRHDAAMNPKSSAVSTSLTSLGFIFHLGLSPASAMVNLTQTALVAYPVMGARWGFGKSSAALLRASQEAARGKNDITAALSADERAAFDEAVRSGVVDVTMAHDLAGIAQGEDRNVSHKLAPVMRAASWMFHHAEKFNRQVTFVAAYRLAREAGTDTKQAYADAVQATYDGHFDYSANNRPRFMQGNWQKVLLLFKQYSQNMVYTFARSAHQALKGASPEDRAVARKTLAGLLTTHAMAAGVLGLPMVTTLLAAASMLGGDDDEPWDAQIALQNLLADTFGQKPAEVIAHGLSRLTPWDISGRVGLDKLIFPDVQEGLEGQRLGEAAMTAALGPVAAIGVNALKGLQEMSEGRYARGLETMAPTVLRGPLKAMRYGSEGVKDKSGIVIQDEVDAASLLGQAAGFSPSEVRHAFEGKSAIVGHDKALQARRSALVEHYAMAAMAKDEKGKTEARAAIAKFNEKNPERRISPQNLTQSMRARVKRIQQAQNGVYLPSKRQGSMEAGRFATPDDE